MDRGDHLLEGLQHLPSILIDHRPEDDLPPDTREFLLQSSRQRIGSLRVVSAIHHQQRITAQNLHPPRRGDGRRRFSDPRLIEGATEESLDRGHRSGKIVHLMPAEESQLDVGVLLINGTEVEQPPTVGEPLVAHIEVSTPREPSRLEFKRSAFCHYKRFGRQVARHQHCTLIQNRQLLGRDLADRVAEVRGVFETDRRHDGNVRPNCIGRIEPTAQARLDDGGIDRILREPGMSESCRELEVGHTIAALLLVEVDQRRQVGHRGRKLIRCHLMETVLISLFDPMKMRRGERAGRQTMAGEEVGRHADGTGLAVGAGHVHDRIAVLRIGEQLEQS